MLKAYSLFYNWWFCDKKTLFFCTNSVVNCTPFWRADKIDHCVRAMVALHQKKIANSAPHYLPLHHTVSMNSVAFYSFESSLNYIILFAVNMVSCVNFIFTLRKILCILILLCWITHILSTILNENVRQIKQNCIRCKASRDNFIV